ncbi:MAG: response regulator [Marinisporobacter sp.]|jgi:two-component system chemotaxis response regulator CheY|nr:response regulator [Marinisporobacter sp.]
MMPKILVVDDAAFMRMSLKMMLKRNGFEVVGEAENGVEAIQKYKKLQPDLVTMDITMPEMQGLDALKAIKDYDSEAKVVMITAMGQERMIKESIMYGAKSFIVKPFNEKDVVKALANILS